MLYETGVINQALAGAAQEIREIYEAVQGRFLSSRMGRLTQYIDGKLVARSNWHPLDGLAPEMQRRYVASYIPWAGVVGRRSISSAGLDRMTWLQIVIDMVKDGHDPGKLDRQAKHRSGRAHGGIGEVS